MSGFGDFGLGARLRYWRERRGRTREALAGLLTVSPSLIGMIERGDRGSGDRLPFLLAACDSLGVDLFTLLTTEVDGEALDPADVRRLKKVLRSCSTCAERAATPRPVPVGVEHLDVVVVTTPTGALRLMERRQALKLGGTTIVATLGGGLAATLDADQARAVAHALDTKAVNAEALHAYAGVLAALRRAEDKVGSQAGLLLAADAHLKTLKLWLAGGQAAAVVPALGRLVAEYGQFCGWLAYDRADAKQAIRYYADALETAQTLGDRPLAAYLTVRIARVEAEAGDRRALPRADHAVALLKAVTNPGRLTAFVGTERAWAYSLWPSPARDRASVLSDRAMGETDWDAIGEPGTGATFAYWFDKAHMEQRQGTVLAHVGQHELASELLSVGAANSAKEGWLRDSANAWTTLARSQAHAGNAGEAADAGHRAVHLLGECSSVRVARDLRQVHRHLAERGNSEAVRALGERLRNL